MPSSSPIHFSNRHFRTLAVFLLGAFLSFMAFAFTARQLRQDVETAFLAAAQERTRSVAAGLTEQFYDVAILRNFYSSSEDVTRQDFDDFTGPLLSHHPSILGFQFLPEITGQNRAKLEAEARLRYPDFSYFRMTAQGKRVEIPRADRFFAVHYLSPFEINKAALGYSADHLPTRQQALERALTTGELSATGRMRLIQGDGEQFGVLVMASVHLQDRRPLGVVQGVFRMGDLVRASLATLEPRGLTLKLLDGSAPESEALLHEEPSRLPSLGPSHAGDLSWTQTFSAAGRQWKVVVVPADGYFDTRSPWQAWITLVSGLAFSSLLTGYVSSLLARQEVIADQVSERTMALSREMEDHRRDTLALKESEARFHQLVEVMDEGMWVLDAQGCTTFVNPRMAEMLGYTPEEMVGHSLFEFMDAEEVPFAQNNMAIRREGISSQHDFRLRKKDGSDLWVIVSGTPIKDEQGNTVSILGMLTDITQRRQEERAHTESQKLESLGVLAGGIAHDFNNLLTAILGNVNLAQLTLPKFSPACPYLENMERTIQRATNLTRQMLAYSGKGRFTVEPLDLNQAVEEISHLLSVSISKKVTLRYHLQPDLPLLMAEASQIQQVVMNLVTNASEAIGDEEGFISIRTGHQTYQETDLRRDFPSQSILPGSFVTLEVSDTGKGMSPEVQARIFEPFFTTKFTGRGLGLSAMQGIVRGHKGGIRVYSEVGKGSAFKLIFPACDERLREAATTATDADIQGSGTILVVDDEPSIREVASGLLRAMGFKVLTASDGQEALVIFQQHLAEIRAVLLDLTMPRLDGVETFRELRKLQPTCRVVLTSGYNQEEALHEFVGKDLAAFVQKPFQRTELVAALRKALEY
ncbi:MAG TPA: CHASE domain-containing protein [Geothrix sp.]|nr:CHASE domain-containing protein [Geothrix sp.]